MVTLSSKENIKRNIKQKTNLKQRRTKREHRGHTRLRGQDYRRRRMKTDKLTESEGEMTDLDTQGPMNNSDGNGSSFYCTESLESVH